ncbi:MAG: hypothetical protein ABH869_00085 [Candidatus Omnitrophota bacterium]
MSAYKKRYTTYRANAPLEYKKYRVKSAIKSFRDLEVYKKTNQYAAELFQFKVPKSAQYLKEEVALLRDMAKHIPKLIAESYGDRFSEPETAFKKLERTAQYFSNVITKIDFLLMSMGDKDKEKKDFLLKILKKYQIQRVKVLNLKRAWERIYGEKR